MRQVAPAIIAAALCCTTDREVSAQIAPSVTLNYSDVHWRHSLDIYLPNTACSSLPLAIYIHGGGWLVGDKADVQPHVLSLLNRGYAVASINYRFSQHATFPAQIHDCKGAIRFLRANAATYGLDPERFAVFGPSSGGHLAALVGTAGDDPSLEGDIGGNLEFSSSAQAVIDLSGPTDLFELAEFPPHGGDDSIISQLIGHPIQDIIDHIDDPEYADLVALVHSANPITHVTLADPPCHITHGEDDELIPISQSQLLYDALAQEPVEVTFRSLPDAGHELPLEEYEIAFDWLESVIPPAKLTDLNCDGSVNVLDLLQLIAAWGVCDGKSVCIGDVNHNSKVDAEDLLLMLSDWG